MSLDLRPTVYASTAQMRMVHAILREKGINRPSTQAKLIYLMANVDSRTQLTSGQAADLIDRLEHLDSKTLFSLLPPEDINM